MSALRRHIPTSAAAAGAGALVGMAVALATLPLMLLLGLAGAGALLLLLRERTLWAVALVLFAALPLAYLPVPDIVLTVSPPALVLLALLLRVLVDRSSPVLRVLSGPAVPVLLLAGWLALTALASPYRAITVGWYVSFATLVVLPALLATRDPEVRIVVSRTWIAVAAVLGMYALAEAFVLQGNPLFGVFYARGDLVQKWSVYRATTSLGHPVSNGSFFAIAVPLALAAALQHRSGLAAAAAVLSAGGVVASGSRSGLAAMLVGAGLVVLRPIPGRRTGGAPVGKLIGAAALTLALVLGSAYLAVRDSSSEGSDSAAFRVTQIPVALRGVAASPILGIGPGAASFSQESLLARIGGAGAFESFWLELVVGAGIPGLVLGAVVVLAALRAALRSGAPGVAGAVVAWTVSASFVNALEGGRPESLVLGLVLALALSGAGRPSAGSGMLMLRYAHDVGEPGLRERKAAPP